MLTQQYSGSGQNIVYIDLNLDLNSLNSPFLIELCALIDQMISSSTKRPTHAQLETAILKLSELQRNEDKSYYHFSTEQEISPIKSK